MVPRPVLCALLTLGCAGLAGSAWGSTPAEQLEFPFAFERMTPIQTPGHVTPGPVRWTPRADQVEVLTAFESVRLTSVPLPDGTTATLDLERLDVERLNVGVHIDGVPAPGALHPLALSVWKGSVEGAPGSEALLSFSNAGSYGWIRRGQEMLHVSSQAGPGNDWTRYEATVMTDAQAQTRGADHLLHQPGDIA